MHSNKKPVLRVISSVLVAAFFLSELSYAEPLAATSPVLSFDL